MSLHAHYKANGGASHSCTLDGSKIIFENKKISVFVNLFCCPFDLKMHFMTVYAEKMSTTLVKVEIFHLLDEF